MGNSISRPPPEQIRFVPILPRVPRQVEIDREANADHLRAPLLNIPQIPQNNVVPRPREEVANMNAGIQTNSQFYKTVGTVSGGCVGFLAGGGLTAAALTVFAAPVALVCGGGVLVGALCGYWLGLRGSLYGQSRDISGFELKNISELEKNWTSTSDDYTEHYRLFTENIEIISQLSTKQGQDSLLKLQQKIFDRLVATLEFHFENQGVPGNRSVLAVETACLLTDQVAQMMPSFAYRVESLIEKIDPERQVPALLRTLMARYLGNANNPLSPCERYQAELKNITGSVPGFASMNWLSKIGSATTDIALIIVVAHVIGEVSTRIGHSTGIREAFMGNLMSSGSEKAIREKRQQTIDNHAVSKHCMTHIFDSIKKTYQTEIQFLPESYQNEIFHLDIKIEEQIASVDREKFGCLLYHRQRILMSGPLRVKRLKVMGENDTQYRNYCNQIDQGVDLLLRGYTNSDQLADLIELIRDNSALSQPTRRTQYYLYGSPGVGKTRFVKELARILGLPICTINLTCEKDLNALVGQRSNHELNILYNPNITEIDLYGLLQKEIIKSGVKNPILFFEESGNFLSELSNNTELTEATAAINRFFDPDCRSLPLGVFEELHLNFMHPTIIFTGNKPLLSRSSLADRIPMIEFPDLSLEKKMSIVENSIETAVSHMCQRIPAQVAALTAKVRDFLPSIEEQEREHPCAGARSALAALDRVVSWANRAITTADMTDAMIEERIRNLYR